MNSLLSLIEASENSYLKRIHFIQHGECKESFSKNDLRKDALKIAAFLQTQGLKAQQPVILISSNSVFFAHAFFGILYAGGVPVPLVPADYLETDFFAQNLSHVVHTCHTSFILSEKTLPTKIVPQNAKVYYSTECYQAQSNFQPVTVNANDLALIQFSSGSTMAPKGVMMTHKTLLTNLQQIMDGMNNTTDEVLTSWLPFYHDMGLIGGLLGILYIDGIGYFSDPVVF